MAIDTGKWEKFYKVHDDVGLKITQDYTIGKK